MKRLISIFMMIAWSLTLHAQGSIEQVLAEVERNNTTLAAQRQNAEAQVAASRTGLLPQNPEVGMAYLWGNPSGLGNRTDFNIRQSFDFPTAYIHRARIAGIRGQQASFEFERQRRELMFQTRLVCTRLIYHNALAIQLTRLHDQAMKIATAFEARLETGDVGIIDYNMARINLLNIAKELEANEVERANLQAGLTGLNGGIPVSFSDSFFVAVVIPGDFDQWFAQVENINPTLQWYRGEASIAERQVRLNAALNLPKFSAGYMSERVTGQEFQGLMAGVTIPLWENRGTARYAKARAQALQGAEVDARHQLYSALKASHSRVMALQATVAGYRDQLSAFSNVDLLGKAFEKGEISLMEYMMGLTITLENERRLLAMEKELNLALAELQVYL